MRILFCLCVIFLCSCCFLGSQRTYALKYSEGKIDPASKKSTFNVAEDYRGAVGFIVPFFPFWLFLTDSVEFLLFDRNEEDCPTITHGNDTLTFRYYYEKSVYDRPHDEGQVYEYRQCRYTALKSWSNEPLKAVYPDGTIDTLYVERKSKFVYLPFFPLGEDFSDLE